MYTILQDGVYILTITIRPVFSKIDQSEFTANLEVSMRGPHGYLSAINWPLLHVIYFSHII